MTEPYAWSIGFTPAHIRLVDASGETFAPSHPSSDHFGRFLFVDVGTGPFTLIMDDPRFEPCRQAGIAAGETVEVTLRGSAGVRLMLRDAETGRAVESSWLHARYRDVDFAPASFRFSRRPKDGVHCGIIPDLFPVELLIEVPDHADVLVQLGRLEPGEVRDIELSTPRGQRVTGTVVESEGNPAAGVRVRLLNTDHADFERHPEEDWSWRGTRTDAEGAFAFEHVGAADYEVHAIQNAWIAARSDWFSVTDSAGPEPMRVALPPRCSLEVRLRDAGSARIADASLVVRPARASHRFESPFSDVAWDLGEWQAMRLGDDGSFVAEGLPPGPVDVGTAADPVVRDGRLERLLPVPLRDPRLLATIEVAPGAVTRTTVDVTVDAR